MTEYKDGQIITITVVTVAFVLILLNLLWMANWACARCPKQPESRSVYTNTCYVIDPDQANETILEHAELPPSDTVVLVTDV
jgi:hypothetical protein